MVASSPVGAANVNANWVSADANYATPSNWDTAPIVPLNGIDTYDSASSGSVDSLTLGAGVGLTSSGQFSRPTTITVQAQNAKFISEHQSTLALGNSNIDRTSLMARKGFLGAGGASLSTSVSS
jgi:hypothetical protein